MRLSWRLLSNVINNRPFFVSTPIFYVNAAPHLGHLYTALVADAIQRFEKLTNPNCNVIFSTGTDEHGTKIQQAAAQANKNLPDYCSIISEEYKDLFRHYNIDFTDYVRTTDKRHQRAVKHFWRELLKEDYVYKAKYSGWYSVNDESFVPESHLREDVIKGEKVKVSVDLGHRLEWTEETNYMFRLSAFKDHLQQWLKKDGVVTPDKFQKQLQQMLLDDVRFPDISISRPASRVHWAIRVPDDEEQSIYVWLDALINYLTVIGYPDDEAMKARSMPWPVDVHVIGKDILKFHGIYWPAFLKAVKWDPPARLVCHSHWTVDGVKMSKSLGNVVSPKSTGVTPDALRYMLLREGTMHSDANFSATKLLNIINSELADTLGNLMSRCSGKALNPRMEFPPLHPDELANLRKVPITDTLLDGVERLPEKSWKHYKSYQFYKVADEVQRVLHLTNLFFETHKPWELSRTSDRLKELDMVLHITLETLRICGIILQPLIPELSQKLLDKLLIPNECRSWQHTEKPSWRISGAIYETKCLQSGNFILFPRIYSDKKNKTKVVV